MTFYVNIEKFYEQTYKRMPLLSMEERKVIFSNIKGVSEVVVQNSLDYTEILNELKPDYVVHGDDWKVGVQAKTRQQIIDKLAEIASDKVLWHNLLLQYNLDVSMLHDHYTLKVVF